MEENGNENKNKDSLNTEDKDINTESTTTQENITTSKNKKKIIILSAIIAVVVLLALIIGLFVFGGKKEDKEQPTTTKQQETTTEKESESLTEKETTSEVETTTEEPTTNEVIESGNNEQLIPAGHENYFYVSIGLRIGWNDSGEMGYEAGDYFYVDNNGNIYYFSSEADKNSFDPSNPNKSYLFYVEGTGLVGDYAGEVYTTQSTETPTQQPTTSTQGSGNIHTEETTTSNNPEDWEQGELFDPSKGTWDGEGGYDPNNQ